jgi:prepilin-type N-terminal cleavage/methylation domain-containing protein
MGEHPGFITFIRQRFQAGTRRTRPGFSLVEIMVTIAIVSVLFSLAFPNYVRARASARVRGCVKQIRNLQAAKDQYAMIHKLNGGAAISFADLVAEELINDEPTCPDGFPYTLGTLGEDVVCTSGLPGHEINGPY